MPELPEVESIRRVLLPDIKNKRIEKITHISPHLLLDDNDVNNIFDLEGQTFCDISRRGKYLCFEFIGGDRLIVHLRMTGRILVLPSEEKDKHLHFSARLSDESFFSFYDTRKFGKFLYIKSSTGAVTEIDKLGLEPFDEKLTGDYLYKKLKNSRRPIKSALLDQTISAGIGNIYSDEILFDAKILPFRLCCDIAKKEYDILSKTIRDTMTFLTEKNVITKEEYIACRAKEYKNTPYIRIYGHAGSPCPLCGNTIKKTVIAGRTACFCDNCQK